MCKEQIYSFHLCYYQCKSCDYSLHKFCAELPEIQNNHPLHPGHNLTLSERFQVVNFSREVDEWMCHVCKFKWESFFNYYCSTCNISMDIICATISHQKINHPSHPDHQLERMFGSIVSVCVACGEKHDGHFFQCTTCPMHRIHMDCALLPTKLLIQRRTERFTHSHPLNLAYSFPFPEKKARFNPFCRVCDGDLHEHLWIYKCDKCRYYVHIDCANSKRDAFMSILQKTSLGKTFKNYKDDEHPNLLHCPFSDEGDNLLKHLFFNQKDVIVKHDGEILNHPSHQHPLNLFHTQTSLADEVVSLHDPMKKIQLLCDGCVKPITTVPFYKCSQYVQQCSFILHEWCTKLPSEVKDYVGHPEHKLVFLPKVPRKLLGVFFCPICVLYSNGFAYGCTMCEYYVCINCAFIPEEIAHEAHPGHLLSKINPSAKLIDRYCKACTYSMDRVPGYHCPSCNIYIHAACALLLPRVIRHKYDKHHPLSLRYEPAENHISEYFCDICEDEFDPFKWFYHCSTCDQSMHTACAPLILQCEQATYSNNKDSIFKFLNVKFGRTVEIKGHSHRLAAFVQGIERHDDEAFRDASMDGNSAGSAKAELVKVHSALIFVTTKHQSIWNFIGVSNCMDIICATISQQKINHPSHPDHQLERMFGRIVSACDACGEKHDEHFFQCIICPRYRIHVDCALLPAKLLIQHRNNETFTHSHPLTLAYSFPFTEKRARFHPLCRVCDDTFNEHLWIYKCDNCRYYVHVHCATSKRDAFMSILLPSSELSRSSSFSALVCLGKTFKNYKDDEHPNLLHCPFSDEGDNLLKHLLFNQKDAIVKHDGEMLNHSSHQHPLILFDTQTSLANEVVSLHDPMKKIQLLCDGCVKPITTVPFHKCSQFNQHCDFIVHEWCAKLPPEVKDYAGHPEHKLVFLPKVPRKLLGVFFCPICELHSNGFTYGCTICGYFVCINCAFIPEEITHEAHPGHLLSKSNPSAKLSKRYCMACKYSMNTIPGFHCPSCDIYIHAKCALLLPRVIRHKYDKHHPLSLRYEPAENHISEYFCDICEDEFDPFKWFYHCSTCDQSMHTACAPLILQCEQATYSDDKESIFEFLNVKFGRRVEIKGHSHRLAAFVQGIERQDGSYILLITLLLLQHALSVPDSYGERDEDAFTLLTLFLIRIAGLILHAKSWFGPSIICYVESKDRKAEGSNTSNNKIRAGRQGEDIILVLETTCLCEMTRLSEMLLWMEPLQEVQKQSSLRCCVCNCNWKEFFNYHCAICNLNIDIICATKSEHKMVHPSHPHQLERMFGRIISMCVACGEKHDGHFFHCTSCPSYWIHVECALLPAKLLIQHRTNDIFTHSHPLTLAYSFSFCEQRARFYPHCRVCDGIFYEHLWIYKCDKCLYYAHVYCAISKRDAFVSILQKTSFGKTFKNYKDDEHPNVLHCPFSDEGDNLLKHLFFNQKDVIVKHDGKILIHPSHQHPLNHFDTQTSLASEVVSLHDPMKKIQLLCDGCVKPITTVPFYKCSQSNQHCDFILHEWCAKLPPEIQDYAGHPNHKLVFLPKVPRKLLGVLIECPICFLPSNGFAYGCTMCEYYVCINCAFIPEEITHEAHPGHLLSKINPYSDKLREKYCKACFNFMFKWPGYHCPSCDIYIHAMCALLLPRVIRHKYDKHHPLSLRYEPAENHISEYFCDICEDEFDPFKWFYHCSTCDQSMHAACAPLILQCEQTTCPNRIPVFIYLNVKFGRTVEIKGHSHRLAAFVQGIERHGNCIECGDTLQYEMIFKCLECEFTFHYDCAESYVDSEAGAS
ncbi:zinc finger, PHD-type [Artemisia annua]|uniref:Zinc finger, PHD-type n=1 Tax=Artemisia annua TaxID=35608 RepID=A0A2U1LFE7_ARTAN|nr:zinc finger, PHD-type [Artemisia annua]